MTVCIEGDVDAGVPHLLADVRDRSAVGEKQRGERVPQVMEPPPFQPRCLRLDKLKK